MVKAVVTGDGRAEVGVDRPDVVDPDDVEMLEDLVVAAVNEGLRMAQELAASKMGGRHRGDRPRRRSAACSADGPGCGVAVRGTRPGAHRRARPAPGVGPKSAQRIAFYLLKAAPEDANRLARRDHRGEGPGDVVPAVLQHRRGRAVHLLPRRAARPDAAVRRRGAPRHRRGRAHPRVPRSVPRAAGRDLADRGHRARAAPRQGARAPCRATRASPRSSSRRTPTSRARRRRCTSPGCSSRSGSA